MQLAAAFFVRNVIEQSNTSNLQALFRERSYTLITTLPAGPSIMRTACNVMDMPFVNKKQTHEST